MTRHVFNVIPIFLLLMLCVATVYVHAGTVESFKITIYPDGSIQPSIILSSNTNEKMTYIVGTINKNCTKITLSSTSPLDGNYSINMDLFISSSSVAENENLKQQIYGFLGRFNLDYKDENGEIHITASILGRPEDINFTKMRITINVNGETTGKYSALIQRMLVDNTTLQLILLGLASDIDVSKLHVSGDRFYGTIMIATSILKDVKLQELTISVRTEEKKVRTTLYLHAAGNFESLIKSFLKLRYTNQKYVDILSLRIPCLELDKLFSKFTPLPPTSFEIAIENNITYIKFPRIINEEKPEDTLSEFASWVETAYGLRDNTTVVLQPYGEIELDKTRITLSKLKTMELKVTAPIPTSTATRTQISNITHHTTDTIYTTTSYSNSSSIQENLYLYIGIGVVVASSIVIALLLLKRKRLFNE